MKTKTEAIVIATIRPWNIKRAKALKLPSAYKKIVITKKEDLTPAKLAKLKPRYIFFPHWSWIIPAEIFEQFECVVFHMTDLPFGRGGSPLQNLLVRGIYRTKVSAIRVEDGVDTGPVYMQRPLNIEKGSAAEIYEKLSSLSFSMLTEIVRKNPKPRAQSGEAVTFARRTPEMSRIPDSLTPKQLYDFIRMLDAPEYPVAFIEVGKTRIEFRNARYSRRKVSAEATFVNI